jgi:hypothetical protein
MARKKEFHTGKQKQLTKHAATIEVALIAKAIDFINIRKDFSQRKTK